MLILRRQFIPCPEINPYTSGYSGICMALSSRSYIPQMPNVSEQQTRLNELRTQETQLNDAVRADTIQAKMESCLSNVNRHLSDYAQRIDLEYSDSPLRLDAR